MKTLTIKDKPMADELDHATMAARQGGTKKLSVERTSVDESRNGLGPAIEFLIERFGYALASGLITYALYRMFML
jgi:hypothetical protein